MSAEHNSNPYQSPSDFNSLEQSSQTYIRDLEEQLLYFRYKYTLFDWGLVAIIFLLISFAFAFGYYTRSQGI